MLIKVPLDNLVIKKLTKNVPLRKEQVFFPCKYLFLDCDRILANNLNFLYPVKERRT